MRKKTLAVAVAVALTAALTACAPSRHVSKTSHPSVTASPSRGTLYTCEVVPERGMSTPLMAAPRSNAHVRGYLPYDGMTLGCEPGARSAAYVHVVAPRRYLRDKTGAASGWLSASDVCIVTATACISPRAGLNGTKGEEPEIYRG